MSVTLLQQRESSEQISEISSRAEGWLERVALQIPTRICRHDTCRRRIARFALKMGLRIVHPCSSTGNFAAWLMVNMLNRANAVRFARKREVLEKLSTAPVIWMKQVFVVVSFWCNLSMGMDAVLHSMTGF